MSMNMPEQGIKIILLLVIVCREWSRVYLLPHQEMTDDALRMELQQFGALELQQSYEADAVELSWHASA